jgi:hypothetical protein
MARWLVAIAAVLIIGVSWWKSHEQSSPPAMPAAESNSASVTTPAAGPRPPGLRDAPVSPDQVEAQRAQEREAVQAIVAAGRQKLGSRYTQETIDASWADAKQVELAQFASSQQISEIHAEPKNLAIDCRRTVCHITADFPSRTASQDWATLYLTGAGSRIANASLDTVANSDGSVRLEIYGLARQ